MKLKNAKVTYVIDRGRFKVFHNDDAQCIEVQFGALKGETFVVWNGRRRINPRAPISITVDYRVQSKITSQLATANQGPGSYWTLWQIAG